MALGEAIVGKNSFPSKREGKIGLLQSLLERGSPNITPSWASLPESLVFMQLSDYHTCCMFLMCMYTPILVLGSRITLPFC